MPEEDICSLLNGKDRRATARCVFGYFDGEKENYFEGSMDGTIPKNPPVMTAMVLIEYFIPEGYNVTTVAEQKPEDHKKSLLENSFNCIIGLIFK